MPTRNNALAQAELARLSMVLETKADLPGRHRCFPAHHAADAEQVLHFVQEFEDVIIPRSIGVQDDEFIDSDDDDYVMNRIRQKYLGDTTVTIVLLGQCTWARKYIDWEIYSSLRSSSTSTRNGLMSVRLPGGGQKFPPRLAENLAQGDDDGYARAYLYPATPDALRACVEDAFAARRTRVSLVKPLTSRHKNNRPCL